MSDDSPSPKMHGVPVDANNIISIMQAPRNNNNETTPLLSEDSSSINVDRYLSTPPPPPDFSLNLQSLLMIKEAAEPINANRPIFAETVFEENIIQVTMAVPIFLSSLSHMLRMTTDAAFAGHLGTDELAAANIGMTLFSSVSVLWMGPAYGITPLCSQAYGVQNLKLLGIWLQMAVMMVLMFSVVTVPLMIWGTRPLMLMSGMDSRPSELAEQFMYTASFAFVVDGIFESLREYLRGQNVLRVPSMIILICTALNFPLNYVLIFGIGSWNGFGFFGCGLALLVTSTAELIGLLAYAWWTLSHTAAWPKWFRLKPLLKRSRARELLDMTLGTIASQGVDLWVATVVSFMAGSFSTAMVAAQGIVYTLWCLAWALFFGIACAMETRMAQLLGCGDTIYAKRAFYAGNCIATVMVAGIAVGVICVIRQVSEVFTTEIIVLDEVYAVRYYLTVAFVASAIGQNLVSALNACALPQKTAQIAFISSVIVNLPLCYVFGVWLEMKLAGLWVACAFGEIARVLAGVWYVLRLDWRSEALKAVDRAATVTPTTAPPLSEVWDSEDELEEEEEQNEAATHQQHTRHVVVEKRRSSERLSQNVHSIGRVSGRLHLSPSYGAFPAAGHEHVLFVPIAEMQGPGKGERQPLIAKPTPK